MNITPLTKAIELAEKYLAEAENKSKSNALACVRFFQAAGAALNGLEKEVDELLTEAKVVALYNWNERSKLAARLGIYLNRYELLPMLSRAIAGAKECLEFARKNPPSYFQQYFQQQRVEDKAAALANANILIDELSQFLINLTGIMNLNREHYAGPSGIDMPVLLMLEKLLNKNDPGNESATKNEIIDLIDRHSGSRPRKGLKLSDDATTAIQKLLNAFRITNS